MTRMTYIPTGAIVTVTQVIGCVWEIVFESGRSTYVPRHKLRFIP